MKKLTFILVIFIAALSARGADEETLRPVLSAYTFQAGTSHLADTYLSPLKFNGWNAGIGYERMQAMKFNPQNWVMQMRFDISVDNATARYSNADLWYAGLNFSWDMMRRWQLPYNLTVGIGPVAQITLGCVYNRRNGNNPASAKADFTVGATGYVAWNYRIGKLPIALRYQPTLPVTGAFFAPDYGELYYEIYLGNHRNLAHCAWWGNYFRFDNLLTLDLRLSSVSLRVGYAGNILSTKINHVVTNKFTHSFVIGVAGEWISLNPRKKLSETAKTISALY